MPTSLAIPLALIGAYIVGSIDFAVIVARMHGVDIHEAGSGNPGTSNVLRTLGRLPAAMVLVGDMLKGTIGAALGWLASGIPDPSQSHWAFAAGLCAVIGHCYPIFHKLKGGKGVATGAGVLLFTVPLAAVIEIATWFVVVKLTKTASIASMVIVVITVPILLWQGVSGMSLVWVALMIALVVWRHRGNIKRMVSGGEQRVTA
jgi:glycerol-3-phosphate acyltransferase PlsY